MPTLRSTTKIFTQSRYLLVTTLGLVPACSLFWPEMAHEPSSTQFSEPRPSTNARFEVERRRAERLAALEAQKRERAAVVEAAEKAIFDEIDRLRHEISTTKNVAELAKPFAEKVMEAARTTRARAENTEMPKLHAEAASYLELAIRQRPAVELFDLLAALPPDPGTDRAVLAACPLIRPLVPDDGVLDFTGTCLDGAGGDATKLVWPNARRDVAAYLQEEKEKALAAAVAAEKAQVARAKVDRYVAAAVFASGRCRFSNCLKDGWTTRIADGDVEVSCSFSNCFKDGWTARFPDGTSATTRCSFSDCAKDGWTTSYSDGMQATTRCSFSNCLKDGWSTDLPGGETVTTRCSFGDCSTQGWETSLPGGKTIRCRCNFGKCFADGATCD